MTKMGLLVSSLLMALSISITFNVAIANDSSSPANTSPCTVWRMSLQRSSFATPAFITAISNSYFVSEANSETSKSKVALLTAPPHLLTSIPDLKPTRQLALNLNP